jgi:hypothetical protein
MKVKLSKQGVTTLMMVFNNGFINMVTGKDADMTDVFSKLEWFVNSDNELVCDNPPILDLSAFSDLSEEE